jgi:hypothetical protein
MEARCVPCEVRTEIRLAVGFDGLVSTNPVGRGGVGGTGYYDAINVEASRSVVSLLLLRSANNSFHVH